MTITFPIDILDGFPGWTPEFDLMWRQEQSRTSGGDTIVKDLGSPLWRMTAASVSLAPNKLDIWRAKLDPLENGLNTFKGYPLSRCYPILYPNGSWPTGDSFNGLTATIHTIGSGNKSLRVDLLPAGFTFSVGDMLMITYGSPSKVALHRVMEAATADGSGITPEFEIRPHLWPGVAVDNLVAVKKPYCIMGIVPGSIKTTAELATGRGTVSFQAIERR